MPGGISALEVDTLKPRLSSRQTEGIMSSNNWNVEQDHFVSLNFTGQTQYFQQLAYQIRSGKIVA
jgi:hypothetical protein